MSTCEYCGDGIGEGDASFALTLAGDAESTMHFHSYECPAESDDGSVRRARADYFRNLTVALGVGAPMTEAIAS
jgi:hypothetical protein